MIENFNPKKARLPSFDTVRRVLVGIDFSLISKQFSLWALQYVAISGQEWVGVDGKAIGGATAGLRDKTQTFINLVRLYCSKQKLSIGNALVSNSKESEIPVVKQLAYRYPWHKRCDIYPIRAALPKKQPLSLSKAAIII